MWVVGGGGLESQTDNIQVSWWNLAQDRKGHGTCVNFTADDEGVFPNTCLDNRAILGKIADDEIFAALNIFSGCCVPCIR